MWPATVVFSGPWKHSGKFFKHLDKVHFHKSNTFSVYHFVLYIYFVIKSEGLLSSTNPWLDNLCFLGIPCHEEYMWPNELSTTR